MKHHSISVRHGPHNGWRRTACCKELATLRKDDERKALPAGLLARKTTVNREWLGQRLGMGHPGSVSRMLGEVKETGNWGND